VVKEYRVMWLGQLLAMSTYRTQICKGRRYKGERRRPSVRCSGAIERDAGTQKLEDPRARYGVWRTGGWGGQGLDWAAVPEEGRCTFRALETNMQEHNIINEISGFRRGLRPSPLCEFTLNLRSVTS
jgi:hypothetical protein